jgi:hypothetical protein
MKPMDLESAEEVLELAQRVRKLMNPAEREINR